MKIVQYIVVKKGGRTYYPKYTSRLTVGNPALASNEVAVKVQLDLPDNIFDKPAFEANIEVPQEAVGKPIIEASVIDNVEQIIKQSTGFEVKLISVEEPKVEDED